MIFAYTANRVLTHYYAHVHKYFILMLLLFLIINLTLRILGSGESDWTATANALAPHQLESVSAPGSCRAPFPHLLEQISSVLVFLYNEFISQCSAGDPNAEGGIEYVAGRYLAPALGQSQPTGIPLLTFLSDTMLLLMPKTELELGSFQKTIEKVHKVLSLPFLYTLIYPHRA